MKSLLANLIAIALAILSLVSLVHAQTPVGYVLDIQGDWYLTGHAGMLRRWQKVPPDGQIKLTTPTPYAYIVIADLSGEIIDSRNCQNGDCSRPMQLPKGHSRPSVLRVAFEAVTQFLRRSPEIYSINRNRSFGPGLVEGVVRSDKGQIDIGKLLRQWGHYYVIWRLRPDSGKVGKWSERVALRTELGQPALIPIPDLKPGVYEINLQTLNGNSYDTFAGAWVLVTADETYQNAAAEFQQAVDLTEQWKGKVDPLASRQFLRAHLHYLAKEAAKHK